MDISDELVKTTILPDGTSSPTLTTRLGHMLTEAESLYGDRDRSFTILGVEFWNGNPEIWFFGKTKQVAVRIGTKCLKDPPLAYFQLAQEIIHLLDPVVPDPSDRGNNLEEGASSHFAVSYPKKYLGVDHAWRFAGTPYDDARKVFEDVLNICPDFGRKIRDKTIVGKPLSKATEQDILKACPNCPIDKARFLAAPFGTRP